MVLTDGGRVPAVRLDRVPLQPREPTEDVPGVRFAAHVADLAADLDGLGEQRPRAGGVALVDADVAEGDQAQRERAEVAQFAVQRDVLPEEPARGVQLTVEEQVLGPGEQIDREHHHRQPGPVDGEGAGREVIEAGVLGFLRQELRHLAELDVLASAIGERVHEDTAIVEQPTPEGHVHDMLQRLERLPTMTDEQLRLFTRKVQPRAIGRVFHVDRRLDAECGRHAIQELDNGLGGVCHVSCSPAPPHSSVAPPSFLRCRACPPPRSCRRRRVSPAARQAAGPV